jgi:hypothetical protein
VKLVALLRAINVGGHTVTMDVLLAFHQHAVREDDSDGGDLSGPSHHRQACDQILVVRCVD